MKRIVTVQDISCVGKCSLTVALPIISAMGIEAAVLPTAVLSAHTAFKHGFTFRDLTSDITAICDHWKREKIRFDAIYTGYLGSFEQLDLMSQFIDDFKAEDTLVFIDPVMGDHGKLYSGFTPEFAKAMARLCSKADIIVPNMTEASFMLGLPYIGEGYDKSYVQDILRKLTSLGAKCAVLTGVSFEVGKIGVMAYDAVNDRFFEYYNDLIGASYHGTGDVFASTCVGALINGKDLQTALQIAADYTAESIRLTEDEPEHNWYGVNFEQAIPYLLDRLSR
ncbi:MAG: pyridoxamine kinase [Clostridia bacterium]|nr:pyridoxamine kinase [Clostridia bacterium]MBQ7038623.1 pyridoxamine kinase [Clostridia bacterium]